MGHQHRQLETLEEFVNFERPVAARKLIRMI
jgi:hypothetical protein